MKTSIFKVLFLVMIAVSVTFVSCRREEPTVATVSVKNASDDFVPGATVRLFAEDGNRIDTTATTNGAGLVTFDFSEFYELGQSGLFVLNIEVAKGIQWGEGIIKVEEEVENEETVVIN